jgi:hypothetical protein
MKTSASGLAGAAAATLLPANLEAKQCPPTGCHSGGGIVWKDTAATRQLRDGVTGIFNQYREKKDFKAIGSRVLMQTYRDHLVLGDLYSEFGNLHSLDLAVQAKQVALKERFGVAPVDYLMTNGYHKVWTNLSTGIHAVADYLLCIPGVTCPGGDNDPWCKYFWGGAAIAFDIAALFTGEGEFALVFEEFFQGSAILYGGLGLYMCA